MNSISLIPPGISDSCQNQCLPLWSQMPYMVLCVTIHICVGLEYKQSPYSGLTWTIITHCSTDVGRVYNCLKGKI
jgi:hypothetical protein